MVITSSWIPWKPGMIFFSVIYLISNIFSEKKDSESCNTIRTGK